MSGQRDPEQAEGGIEELLRKTGARTAPSADVREAVRQAVHAEWLAMAHERMRRRRRIGFGVAAAAAVAMLAVMIGLRIDVQQPVAVAVIARVDGNVSLQGASQVGRQALQVGREVMTGETLSTGAAARMALDFGPGLSVRIDAGSKISLPAAGRIVLHEGAVYVDASSSATNPRALEIETSGLSIRHLGTQYQVRTQAGDAAISVREGRVEVTHRGTRNTAAAGEQLLVARNGSVARNEISPQDRSWAWAGLAAPPFQIADQPLTVFLHWVARETGRTVVFASAEDETAATQLILRGSIADLDPNAALAAVLSTTQFERTPTEDRFIALRRRD